MKSILENSKCHLSYNIDDSVVLCQRTRCEVPPNPSEVSSLSSALYGEHERRVDGNGEWWVGVCVIPSAVKVRYGDIIITEYESQTASSDTVR